VRIRLEPGDLLTLVTDGVIEARHDGQMFTMEGAVQVLSAELPSAHAVAVALEQAVLAHAGGDLNDDMAAVIVRVPREAS
jgi:serine phosphatase RsbU (regulator of sigma subunit)